ncbi:hypothetical protein PRNP1_003698 [Phytophthora ramorum]
MAPELDDSMEPERAAMAPPELPVIQSEPEPELLWAVVESSDELPTDADSLLVDADDSDAADAESDDVAFEEPEVESATAALALVLADEVSDEAVEEVAALALEDEATAVDEELVVAAVVVVGLVVAPETLERAKAATMRT